MAEKAAKGALRAGVPMARLPGRHFRDRVAAAGKGVLEAVSSTWWSLTRSGWMGPSLPMGGMEGDPLGAILGPEAAVAAASILSPVL